MNRMRRDVVLVSLRQRRWRFALTALFMPVGYELTKSAARRPVGERPESADTAAEALIAALRDERRDLIDALRDAHEGIAKAKVALERESCKGAPDERLKVAVYDAEQAYRDTALALARFTTVNA